jgi:hypothetical protein
MLASGGAGPLTDKVDGVYKFGLNSDVDIATAPEDVWDGGGLYSFPSAAATTTIESDSANDDLGGTGAETVEVFGLDANWKEISETVTMDGATPVTLANDYFRVFRARTLSVGSNGTNVGNITVQHGATVLAQITAGEGQTLMAIFTVADDYRFVEIWGWGATVTSAAQANMSLRFLYRTDSDAWKVLDYAGLKGAASSILEKQFFFPVRLPPKTDLRVEVASSSANGVSIAANFAAALVR